MPPAAANEKGEVNWGLPAPQAGFPRPRQEDCVPLHPLLSSYLDSLFKKEKAEQT